MGASSSRRWDVAIVGGGHNGLVAAYYLASAGLSTVVLERRELVGGCAVTEEFAPGFRASTGAYVLSMLREPVWRDLRLVERGVTVDPAGPSLNLHADGSTLLLDDDLARTQAEVARFSASDARALPAFEAELGRIAELITPLIDTTPPDPGSLRPREVARLARLGGMAARHRASDRRRHVPVRNLGDPVSAGVVLLRAGARGARLARDQRLHGGPFDARHGLRAPARSRI